MSSPNTIASIFLSGDRPFRSKHLARYWALMAAARDPIKAVETHALLVQTSPMAADLFRIGLEEALKRPFAFYWHEVLMHREYAPLPS